MKATIPQQLLFLSLFVLIGSAGIGYMFYSSHQGLAILQEVLIGIAFILVLTAAMILFTTTRRYQVQRQHISDQNNLNEELERMVSARTADMEDTAAKLIIANKELAFQSEEKEKRAAELTVANKELAFQSEEKEKRAAELTVANKELAFQNHEKEKRALELILANKELAFQNREKGKRASELLAINAELQQAEASIYELNQDLEQKVTDRTALLEAANKELESFSYSVSHDLRAPMCAIVGFTRIINKEYAEDMSEEQREIFRYIESSSIRLSTIIDDLLVLAKSGKERLKLTEFNIGDLINSVWDDLLFSAPHQAVMYMDDMPTVYADSSMIQQVLVNLLSNAIKYSSKGKIPVIKIAHEIHDGRIIISIRDNGVGFDMKYANRLFGAFQRLHGMSEFEGTGVGLTLVKRIIDRHGGEVWAEGKLNEGATFYFALNVRQQLPIPKMQIVRREQHPYINHALTIYPYMRGSLPEHSIKPKKYSIDPHRIMHRGALMHVSH